MTRTPKSLRTAIVLLLALALIPGAALAQEQDQKKKKKKKKVATVTVEVFELYDQASFEELTTKVEEARAGGAKVNAEALFLDGLVRERQEARAVARQRYEEMAQLGEDDPWHWIGLSAQRTLEGNLAEALVAADRAAELAPSQKLAHFQRGRVLTRQTKHADAAQAYVRALELDGDFAYAHYFAGMSYHESRNLVAAANHLTRFLQLAPEAPEKVQVQGILATIQG